jgi:UPF0755 protein
MKCLLTKKLWAAAISVIVLAGIVFSFPAILVFNTQNSQKRAFSEMEKQFPVTVDPKNKTIVESERVNKFLESPTSTLQAAIWNIGNILGNIFTWTAVTIADASWYQSIAAVDGRIVNITPGMRKEQVASEFARVLSWNSKQKKEFLTIPPDSHLPLTEGSFSPGIYIVTKDITPASAQILVNNRFSENILSRYGTTTSEIVPLDQALNIASLIEREAGGADDRRLISGIIWNRLFIDMNLQIDATLQYVKADGTAGKNWWPEPIPADRFRKSPYNTYLNKGLPPTPIANPSVASVLAALNPKNTTCLFYFHDSAGRFHCSDTYDQHVALLKKYYGRGK